MCQPNLFFEKMESMTVICIFYTYIFIYHIYYILYYIYLLYIIYREHFYVNCRKIFPITVGHSSQSTIEIHPTNSCRHYFLSDDIQYCESIKGY